MAGECSLAGSLIGSQHNVEPAGYQEEPDPESGSPRSPSLSVRTKMRVECGGLFFVAPLKERQGDLRMNPDRDDLQQDPTSQHGESTTQDSGSSPHPPAEQTVPESPPSVEPISPDMSQEPESGASADFDGSSDPPSNESSAGDSSVMNLLQDIVTISEGDFPTESEALPTTSPVDSAIVQKVDRQREAPGITRGVPPTRANAVPVASQSSETGPQPSTAARAQPSADVPSGNPRLRPTADGGPPLARPIVLVSLRTDELHAVVTAALKLAIDRDTKTLNQIAEQKVNFAFWQYKAEQRVLNRR